MCITIHTIHMSSFIGVRNNSTSRNNFTIRRRESTVIPIKIYTLRRDYLIEADMILASDLHIHKIVKAK
ncbi:hypothetical protein KFK09_016140 [Dendrobium nobile]|uniref:Uncharacterized protein n=1 Tax=Dendrobium nobile TaxID=94219 RepID=A0A8T3AYI7_DENNO|nr:hypothetical protein KFK09_016140 [Dendrobium nobile]